MRISFAMLLVACAATAAPVPPDSTPRDREGNPLPKGATARLGSLAFTGPQAYHPTFSPDGKQVFGLTDTGFVGWNANTGKRLAKDASPLLALELESMPAKAGTHFVTSRSRYVGFGNERETTLTVLDTSGKEVASVNVGNVFTGAPVTVSPDGKRLVFIQNAHQKRSTLHVFDLTTGKRVRTHELSEWDKDATVSADSKTVYVPRQFKPLRRYDLDTGKELPALDAGDLFPERVLCSPDGKTALVTCQTDLQPPGAGKCWLLFDLATGKLTKTVEFEKDRPRPIAFVGPRAVLAGGSRHPTGLVRGTPTASLWNLDTGAREWEVPTPGFPSLVSPDGKRFVSAFGNRVVLHDTATGARLDSAVGHTGSVMWVGFSADGATVTTFDTREVSVWALNGEHKFARVLPELELRRDRFPTGINPHAWATRTGNDRWELVGWDFDRREIGWRRPAGTDRTVDRVWALPAGGGRVVALVWNEEEQVQDVFAYDAANGKLLGRWVLKKDRPVVRLSDDGKTLFVRHFTKDATGIIGLDALTGKEVTRGMCQGQVVGLSGDGSKFATIPYRGDTRPTSLVVSDTATGKEVVSFDVGVLNLHDYSYPRLLFAPSGKQVAMLLRTSVLVCDIAPDAQPRKLDANGSEPSCAAFAPNSAALAVGYADGTALVWDLTAPPKK